jgi:4-hydroxyphenylpyruvate dioxygenase
MPPVTARDAMRSLVFLEDQLAQVLTDRGASLVVAAPPPARRTDTAFLELAAPPGDPTATDLLSGLGFALHGRHRAKPVTWWRNGGAHVVLNEGPGHGGLHGTALGVVAPPIHVVADRAKALLWPAVATTRGDHDAALPGISSPSGWHVFVSDAPDGEDHWQRDFDVVAGPVPGGLLGLDHVGVSVRADQLNEEVGFLRTLFDLRPGPVQEFMEPHGRLRSRALRPPSGDLRFVLNVEDGPGAPHRTGINQVALRTDDVVAAVDALRSAGVPLMPVPTTTTSTSRPASTSTPSSSSCSEPTDCSTTDSAPVSCCTPTPPCSPPASTSSSWSDAAATTGTEAQARTFGSPRRAPRRVRRKAADNPTGA